MGSLLRAIIEEAAKRDIVIICPNFGAEKVTNETTGNDALARGDRNTQDYLAECSTHTNLNYYLKGDNSSSMVLPYMTMLSPYLDIFLGAAIITGMASLLLSCSMHACQGNSSMGRRQVVLQWFNKLVEEQQQKPWSLLRERSPNEGLGKRERWLKATFDGLPINTGS
jgi:hypothetical protein